MVDKDVFVFSGDLPSEGLEWVSASKRPNARPSRWLVRKRQKPRESRGGGFRLEWKDPREEFPALRPREATRLLREFADLEATEEAVLEFANRTGFLTTREQIHLEDGVRTSGESMATWTREIEEFRFAWKLAQAYNKDELDTLRDLLSRCPKSSEAAFTADGGLILFNSKPLTKQAPRDPKDCDEISLADARIFAPMQLARLANDKLVGDVSATVILPLGKPTRGDRVLDLSPLSPSTSGPPFKIRMRSCTLRGFLWYQFAEGLQRPTEYKICPTCEKPFAVNPKSGSRSKRAFCSNPCRYTAYRRRKEKAQRLRSEGMKPREIAQQLDANVEAVRRWLKEDQDKKGRRARSAQARRGQGSSR